MTKKDAMILGIITILVAAFMFCYFSGFNPTFVFWTVIVTVAILGIFFFAAYKKGILSIPKKK